MNNSPGNQAHLEMTSWTEGGPAPRNYRAVILSSPSDNRETPTRVEVGSTLGPATVGLVTAHVAGEQLGPLIPTTPPVSSDAFDAIGLVRAAFATAHAPIVTSMARRVRVSVSVFDGQGGQGHILYIADARTYEPVEVIISNVLELTSYFDGMLGLGSLTLLAPRYGPPIKNGQSGTFSFRYQGFRYERATASERKLAEITADHSTAAGSRSDPRRPRHQAASGRSASTTADTAPRRSRELPERDRRGNVT